MIFIHLTDLQEFSLSHLISFPNLFFSKFKITFRSISYLAERKFKSPMTRRQRRCNPCASLKLNQSREKYARWWICGLRFQRIQRPQWNKKKKTTTTRSHLRARPRRFPILLRPRRVIPSTDLKGRIPSDHRRHLWTPRNVVPEIPIFFLIRLKLYVRWHSNWWSHWVSPSSESKPTFVVLLVFSNPLSHGTDSLVDFRQRIMSVIVCP